ncbi:hypothetical protein HDV00_010943 [Rhizophlyctis rosea]|nr:hypothetical protein HDV00_010943 [Rhizophlyctis rosea]
MVGTTGKKNAQIREHLAAGVGSYNGLDTSVSIRRMTSKRTMRLLIAKPSVKTMKEQNILIEEAREAGVVCAVEFHKRFDPMYDLNSHYIDIHAWGVKDFAVPVSVMATAATGVATSALYNCVAGTELFTQVSVLGISSSALIMPSNPRRGCLNTEIPIIASHYQKPLNSASWVSPKSDVHTQQHFHYMGHTGELRIDQAHRGYTSSLDSPSPSHSSHNPLYIRYTPDSQGHYVGQGCYSHRSIEEWADTCVKVNRGEIKREEAERLIPTIESSAVVTAILEAGRRSLDGGGVVVDVEVGKV